MGTRVLEISVEEEMKVVWSYELNVSVIYQTERCRNAEDHTMYEISPPINNFTLFLCSHRWDIESATGGIILVEFIRCAQIYNNICLYMPSKHNFL